MSFLAPDGETVGGEGGDGGGHEEPGVVEQAPEAEQKQRDNKNAKTAGLLIASIASVKGLEFEQVLMPYLAHGEFPEPQADLGEETNTLYVGLTRARRFLTLYAPSERPSMFMATLTKPGAAGA